jgi:hypothetical protein
MSSLPYLFRELLGTIRARSAVSFLLTWLCLFLFLGSVAAFFLLVPSRVEPPGGLASLPIEEIRAYLSPRLSSASVDALYLEIREREDIAAIQFRFAQELRPQATGGVFLIEPATPDQAAGLAEFLATVNGVTEVEEIRTDPGETESPLTGPVRIALLVVLVGTIVLAFLFARRGYWELLHAFSGEIRTMRLSGVPEGVIVPLVVGLGALIGLLAGILLLVVLFLLHYTMATATAPPAWEVGLSSGVRVIGVSLVNLLLGLVLGGLIGLLGVSVLGHRDFDPLP